MGQDAVQLRREYNTVAARIDSLVREMGVDDPEALDTSRLPPPPDEVFVPEGHELVMVFWADDEAKVWLNGYFVGETRLTPVEYVVPPFYLKSTNTIRVRCWDTDWVESGLLLGLYLRTVEGQLHPIVVSDATWEGVGGPVEEIAYAHSLPDISNAVVVWGTRVFGLVEMTRSFEGTIVRETVTDGDGGTASATAKGMRYHDFISELAWLEAERQRLADVLRRRIPVTAERGFAGGTATHGLTLGKAGVLEEAVSKPISEGVEAWSQSLAPEARSLVYPERQKLRGEAAATEEGGEVPTGDGDARLEAYRPPIDRRNTQPDAKSGAGAVGTGEGSAGETVGRLGGGSGGRRTRLALLIPTFILAAYVTFAFHQLRQNQREVA